MPLIHDPKLHLFIFLYMRIENYHFFIFKVKSKGQKKSFFKKLAF